MHRSERWLLMVNMQLSCQNSEIRFSRRVTLRTERFGASAAVWTKFRANLFRSLLVSWIGLF